MKKREFLMLAQTFNAKKHGIGGWFLSEKIDGQRAFWDGGITRGMPKTEVPWANNEKDGRLLKKQFSTGLWSRLGNIIHAPDWWLDELPPIMLDGELWHGVRGHGERQNLSRIIKPLEPGVGWKRVRYYVFDMPGPAAVFQDGQINNPNFRKIFKGFKDFVDKSKLEYCPSGLTRFESIVNRMQVLDGNVAIAHTQERLPFQTQAALDLIQVQLERICDVNGEGLILRKPESFWVPKRVHEVLKVKKLDDDEGTVMGYITGRETDKGSKLLGLMGALILNYKGKRLELSGFTDQERQLISHNTYCSAQEWAEENPGQECPEWISSAYFPRGTKVTFRYRGTSLDGIPTEARYWRKRV